MKHIGLVLGSKESTPLECWVGVDESACVQLDDVLTIQAQNPETGEEIRYFGIVDRVEKSLEGLDFHSDSERVSQGLLPYSLSYQAHLNITRIEPEIYTPPQPGLKVYRALNQDFDDALYFSGMQHRLPAGLLQNGQPAWFNFDFLDGTKGGHISISGISGVATKTSYTLFLLHGIFTAPSLPDNKQKNAHAIIFNVKEEDLFYLDQPNKHLSEKERAKYTQLNLEAKPFQDVGFYAPCASEKGELVPATVKTEGVQVYGWSLRAIAEEQLLRYLFAEQDTSHSNLGFVIDRISEKLAEMGEQARREKSQSLSCADGTQARLLSLQDLLQHLQQLLEDSEDDEQDEQEKFYARRALKYWFGSNASATVKAFLRRFDNAIQHVKHFVRPEMRSKQRIDWQARQLTVVDIHSLHARAQMFVVGALLRQIFEYKSQQRDKRPVFIVLDELNRYAPRNGWSPIKEMLLDIAERGRSMGLILMGAQQTASEVEKRIVSNAALRVNGRLDGAEASAREYDYLRGNFRQRALILRPGAMIIQQPELPSPLMVNVPWPAWATRAAEVDNSASKAAVKAELKKRLQL